MPARIRPVLGVEPGRGGGGGGAPAPPARPPPPGGGGGGKNPPPPRTGRPDARARNGLVGRGYERDFAEKTFKQMARGGYRYLPRQR